jgi:putative radical SAM enzyme (TIGR03279 family)
LKRKAHEIIQIMPGSIGEELDLVPGDKLLSINDQIIWDIIDYETLCSDENIRILIEKKDGVLWDFEIEKAFEEGLGLVFKPGLMDVERNCANHCIFCFIDQLPEGRRASLYYKDDDWRLSFIMGNYITLTNLSDDEIQRIIDRRVSPLYISVHTTNPSLRVKMLGNKRAGNILDILRRFAGAGLTYHCQIVLCRGMNDGEELNRTLRDLWSLYPSIKSTAVVPVGLTKHRTGLYPLLPYDRGSAEQVLLLVEAWQKNCLAEAGTAFVFAADEFYMLGEKELPTYKAYEDFPQIENGVGLLVKFEKEFNEAWLEIPRAMKKKRRVSIVTGYSAAPFIEEIARRLNGVQNLTVEVFSIMNHFFGPTVTVAGLVTGRDIIEQLKGKELGDLILLPTSMLKAGEDIFLDDVSLEEVERELQTKVTPVRVNGRDLLMAVMGIESDE